MPLMMAGGRFTKLPTEVACDHRTKSDTMHINYLELLAVFLGLKTFFKHENDLNVRVRIDNSTASSVINHMGTSHSDQ